MSLTDRSPLHCSHILFFAATLEAEEITLDPVESRHACAVLRRSEGDEVYCTDGKGTLARGIIRRSSTTAATVQIISRSSPENVLPAIRLLVGLPERDAFESLLVDATALGASHIIPVIAEYSQKPWWSNNWDKCATRFRLKMITALKQSKNLLLPVLEKPCRLKEALENPPPLNLLADQEGASINSILGRHKSPESIAAAVGPPGGFSPKETELFALNKFLKAKIAPYRLRTELATTTILGQIAGFIS